MLQGAKVADLFRGDQPCSNVEKYRQEMAELINSAIQRLNLKEVGISNPYVCSLLPFFACREQGILGGGEGGESFPP